MRVTLFIDSLGPGGAQRQITLLAVALKKRHHQVRMLVYHPHDHFLPALEDAGVPCQLLTGRTKWQKMFEVRNALRHGLQDVVLAFLGGPALYAELGRVHK